MVSGLSVPSLSARPSLLSSDASFIETLVFALAAKASLGVRGAAIDVGMIIIVIWVGMFLLNPKQVDLGCHVGGIQDMQPIRRSLDIKSFMT